LKEIAQNSNNFYELSKFAGVHLFERPKPDFFGEPEERWKLKSVQLPAFEALFPEDREPDNGSESET